MGDTKSSTPPYLSYVTFRNTIQSLALEGKLPRQIDRTVLGTMSGAGQKQFLAALRFFGLIDEYGTPDDRLSGLARANDDDWKDYMAVMLKEHYPNEIEQLDDASPKTLRESFVSSFEGIGSSLVEPGIRFLVTAAKDCSLPVSAHLSKRKARAASPPRRRPKKDARQAALRDTDSGEQATTSDAALRSLLSKFPDFDPAWSPEQQKAWFAAYEKLLSMHTSCASNEPHQER